MPDCPNINGKTLVFQKDCVKYLKVFQFYFMLFKKFDRHR